MDNHVFNHYKNKREAMSSAIINANVKKGASKRGIDPQKHFCIIQTTKGRILACGDNHMPGKSFLPSIHAEGKALTNAAAKIAAERGRGYGRKIKVDIIVARTTGGNSRPCSECARDIYTNNAFTVRSVIYSNPDDTSGYSTIRSSSLFDTRHQHITKFNLRRMGYLDDNNALFNPFTADTENNNLSHDMDPINDTCNLNKPGATHCHSHDADDMDEEDEDEEGEKPK